MVVQGSEDAHDLAKALTGDQRPDDNQGQPRVEHNVRYARGHEANPQEYDPPGDLLKEGVQHLAGPELADEADGHASDNLHQTQGHGAHQNHQRIVQRREQRRQGKIPAGSDLHHLRQEVPEKAAGDGPHNKGGDAAQLHQAHHVAHGALGTVFPGDNGARQEHQKPVAHVRHHDTIEQNEKRCHQRIGVHVVVGGEGVHLRHHVQRLGEPVVLQLHRHLRNLLLRGVGGLPGAAQLLQQGLYAVHSLRRGPALEKENGAVGQQPLRVDLPGLLGPQAFRVELEQLLLAALRGDGRRRPFLGPPVLLQLPLQVLEVLRRRAGQPLEGHHAERVGTQDLHHRRLVRPAAHQQAVILLLVRADLIELSRRVCRRQLGLDRAGIRSAGTHAHPEQHVLRALQLHRHIQGSPGQQGRLPRQQAALLALEADQRLKLLADVPAHSPGLLHSLSAQKLVFRHQAALDEQPILCLGVLLQGCQSGICLGDVVLG